MLSSKRPDRTIETIIGENTVFEGKLICETNVRVEGRVSGDIECSGEVIIGENAQLHSTITARDVTIAGTVHGNVTTKGKLVITASGQLFGSIEAGAFVMTDGGVFQGTCTMTSKNPSTVSPIQGKQKESGKHGKNNSDSAAHAG